MAHPLVDAQPPQKHESENHGSLVRITLTVFIALCILTCASLLTYTDFWQERVPLTVGRAVMMAVSITKAFLVSTFFMHLWWEARWKYVVTLPAMCVSTLLCLALVPDIGKRTVHYDNARWLNAAEPMPYSVGDHVRVAQPARGSTIESAESSSAGH
ncbi:MAG: cytochrome C oxidase subunit IV family protein [Planctomycetales bacterium]|nr:cytochrome C oxidase subunit IV family protein [Planctomycetales bacterium]